jgi:hypothetical protein
MIREIILFSILQRSVNDATYVMICAIINGTENIAPWNAQAKQGWKFNL